MECPFAFLCWQRFDVGILGIQASGFYNWFLDAMNRFRRDKVCQIAMVCWSLWRARNGVVWQSKSSVANGVVMSAIAYLHQWSRAQNVETKAEDSCTSVEHWILPTINTMKVNVDASVVSGNDSFGVGWIARDHQGNVVDFDSKLMLGSVHPSMAEAVGVKEALSWVKESNANGVVIESDCQAVVSAICQSVPMSSPFGLVISDCRRIIASLNNVTIVHVKRSANKAANWLARSSCSYSGRRSSGGSVPTELTAILLADLDV